MKSRVLVDKDKKKFVPATHAVVTAFNGTNTKSKHLNVQDALEENILQFEDMKYGVNFVKGDFIPGAIVNNGEILDTPHICVLTFEIPDDCKNIKMTGVTETFPVSSNIAVAIAFYDENNVFISNVYATDRTRNGYQEMIINIPEGAKYAKVNRWINDSCQGVKFQDFYCRGLNIYDLINEKVGKGSSYQPAPSVNFQDIAKVEINSELLYPNSSNNSISPLDTSKNTVGIDNNDEIDGSVTITFTRNGEAWTDSISIAYQGNTSLNDAKKGFGIDTAEKHRFGDWIEFDSFHLKAYYTDWMHARDLVCNKVLEQIYLSRPIETRRPYMLYNNFTATDYRLGIDCGAKCHIDGFPIELYINGVYWGLYSFNVKKDRANYLLNKSDYQHIMCEVGTEGMIDANTGNIKWRYCEFRNPKGLKNYDGTKYDGDHPQEIEDSDVKKSWIRFASFLHSLTNDTAKETCEDYINSQEFIDNVVFSDSLFNIDVFRNNTLWTTWDAVVDNGIAVSGHWSPLIYDTDKTFGKVEVGWPRSTNGFLTDATLDVFAQYADAQCPEIRILRGIYYDDIANRYRELRNLGIISVENITRIFSKWTLDVGADVYKREVERWPSLPSLPYDSVKRCIEFLTARIAYLDSKYSYML